MKILVSICLFLVVAVMFKHPSVRLTRQKLCHGKHEPRVPICYRFPVGMKMLLANLSHFYRLNPLLKRRIRVKNAMPASGEITQTFEANGEGIILETSLGSKVEAINEGVVIFAGEKEGIGKTVVIQHANKSESWYGQLEKIDVKLYDLVKKGKEVGQVTVSEDGSKGRFYLAIKENDAFIDPKKVISFD